jgi:hypothetical protein
MGESAAIPTAQLAVINAASVLMAASSLFSCTTSSAQPAGSYVTFFIIWNVKAGGPAAVPGGVG